MVCLWWLLKVVKTLLAAGAAPHRSGHHDEDEDDYPDYDDDIWDADFNYMTPRQIAHRRNHKDCLEAIEVRERVAWVGGWAWEEEDEGEA